MRIKGFNVALSVGLIFCLWVVIRDKNQLNDSPSKADLTQPKVILFWTKYYQSSDFQFGFGQEPFINAGCAVNNCLTTNDRQLLNSSDAVIFHAGDYSVEDLPAYRLDRQRFVYVLLETLPMARETRQCFSPSANNYFNWTMTHRRDSDIHFTQHYGAIRRRHAVQYPSKIGAKTKMMAWFASNCFSHGQREKYIQQLSHYVDVDVYGKCGNLTCLPKLSPQCARLLDPYKFYFAAENSVCPDYVSEKFYRALDNGVVPVVYGGADYAAFAPPHSYINVADFKSPKELADYLFLLDGNDNLYLEYFAWKKDYEVVLHPMDGWCDLCAKLNDPSLPTKSYQDIAKWWFDDRPCVPGMSFIN